MEEPVSTKSAPESSYVVLWTGENPALHEALLQELDLAEIPYANKPIGEQEIKPDPLPIDWEPRFGFEVAVHHPDLSRAKEILERLLSEGELADVELPAEDDAPEDEVVKGDAQPSGAIDEKATVSVWAGDDAPEDEVVKGDAQPSGAIDEKATVSVWAGDDAKIVEFLTAALRENEIPIRTVNEGALTVVYVPPSSAARAREIVREITEGVPPA
jgi:hypothetical protein